MSGKLRLTLLLLFLCGATGSAAATTFVELTVPTLLTRAETALHAVVTDVRSEQRDGEPWTVVTFRVEQDFLTDAEEDAAEDVDFAFLGGTRPDGSTLAVELMPVFTVGDEVLLLAYEADYYSPIVGFNQGVWWLEDQVWRDSRAATLGVDDVTGELTVSASGSSADVVAALAAVLEGR